MSYDFTGGKRHHYVQPAHNGKIDTVKVISLFRLQQIIGQCVIAEPVNTDGGSVEKPERKRKSADPMTKQDQYDVENSCQYDPGFE